jgi:hypothetical protein
MEEPIEEIEQEAVEPQEADNVEEAATSAEESTETEGEESRNDTDEKPEGKGVQKRIDRLTRQKYDEKRRADLATQKLEELQKAVPTPVAGKPAIDSYDTYEDFQEALVDWKIEQRDVVSRQNESLQAQANTAATQQATVESSAQLLIGEGNAKYADFQAVAGTIPPAIMTNELIVALADSETGADIAYHLGKNPAEAAALQNLSPVQLGRELARMEASISQPTVVTTKTPEPIKPSGATAQVKKDPADMTDKEFAKWRRKAIAGRSTFG